MRNFFSFLRKKMSSQILAILLGIALLLSVATVFILYTTIRPSYKALEEKAMATNIYRVQEGFAREQEYVQKHLTDWTRWDEAWLYCDSPNKEFEQSNLSHDAMIQFAETGVNLLAIFNSRHTLLFSSLIQESANPQVHRTSKPSEAFLNEEIFTKLSTSFPTPQGNQTGMCATDSGTFIFAIGPVLKSDGSGPASGTMLMGKRITKHTVEALALQTQVSFELIPYAQRDLHPGAAPLSSLDTPYVLVEGKSYFYGYSLLYDYAGAPLYIIKTTHTPTIVAQGNRTIIATILLTLASFIITMGAIFFLLHHYLVAPLRLLSKEVHNLADAHKIEGKIHMQREDEIGTLAQSFNYLLQHLYRQSEKLRKASLYDELTKTYNRPRILELWEAEQQRYKRYAHPLSLMIIGMDKVDDLNDLSVEMDKEVKKIASLLKRHLRTSDILGRFSEHQFLVLLPYQSAVGAMHSAERIRKLQAQQKGHASHYTVTVSIGICSLTEKNVPVALTIAEENLQRAQEMGGNSIISSNG